jgi:tight adherence protein B
LIILSAFEIEKIAMPPILLFILLLFFSFGVAFYLLRPTKTESAVQQHLENIQVSRAEGTGATILKGEGYSSNPSIREIIRQLPGAAGTLNLVRQSGRDWPVSHVMGISLLATVLTAWIASLFLPTIFLPMLSGVAAGSIPYIYLFIIREARFRKCDQVLPEAIDLMARGLRAGHALNAVLEMVGNEIAEPLASEFRRLHEEHALGLPLRDATLNMVSRLPRDDMRFLATAILLQKETGGNLALILDKTAAVARERARLRGQLRIYTAQGRITGWILCLMPFIMFGLLSMVNWKTEKILFTDDLGRTAVYAGLVFMVIGVLVIRKIINVKV